MLSWFKAKPEKKLQQQYEAKLAEAQHAQRNGDMRLFAEKSTEADAIFQRLQQLLKP